jgi:hypothetical protein
MFGYSAASFGNSYAATEGANANGSVGAGGLASARGGAGGDPYAWAQRLRDIPDEDVLAELSMMGFTDASMQSRRGGGGGERARAGHSNNGVKRVAGAGAASRCWSHVHAAFPTPHLAQPSPPCSLHALSMLSPRLLCLQARRASALPTAPAAARRSGATLWAAPSAPLAAADQLLCRRAPQPTSDNRRRCPAPAPAISVDDECSRELAVSVSDRRQPRG